MHRSLLPTDSSNTLTVNVDSTNIANTFVDCTFEPGYSCTIDYGTDSTYTNLVHRDNSSTMEGETTINLSENLQENITYYYIVSAVSTSQCERVRGRFRSGGYSQMYSWHRDDIQVKGRGINEWVSGNIVRVVGNITVGCLDSLYGMLPSDGLCKTWTLDWTGLTKTAVYRQRMPPVQSSECDRQPLVSGSHLMGRCL